MPNIMQGFGLEIMMIAVIGYLCVQSYRNRKTETLSSFFTLSLSLMLFLLINVPVRISDLRLLRWDSGTVFLLNALFIALETLTANAFSDDVKRCLEAGMNDHLAKPFEIGKVVTAIKRYTE